MVAQVFVFHGDNTDTLTFSDGPLPWLVDYDLPVVLT